MLRHPGLASCAWTPGPAPPPRRTRSRKRNAEGSPAPALQASGPAGSETSSEQPEKKKKKTACWRLYSSRPLRDCILCSAGCHHLCRARVWPPRNRAQVTMSTLNTWSTDTSNTRAGEMAQLTTQNMKTQKWKYSNYADRRKCNFQYLTVIKILLWEV